MRSRGPWPSPETGTWLPERKITPNEVGVALVGDIHSFLVSPPNGGSGRRSSAIACRGWILVSGRPCPHCRGVGACRDQLLTRGNGYPPLSRRSAILAADSTPDQPASAEARAWTFGAGERLDQLAG